MLSRRVLSGDCDGLVMDGGCTSSCISGSLDVLDAAARVSAVTVLDCPSADFGSGTSSPSAETVFGVIVADICSMASPSEFRGGKPGGAAIVASSVAYCWLNPMLDAEKSLISTLGLSDWSSNGISKPFPASLPSDARLLFIESMLSERCFRFDGEIGSTNCCLFVSSRFRVS